MEHEGKIDTSSPLNSLQYSSSYSKLEHLLLEHSITTEIPPNDLSSRSALSRSKQASDKKSTAGGAALRYGSGVAAAYASGAYAGGGSGGKPQSGEAVEGGAANLSASKSAGVVSATEGDDMNVENAENQTAKDAEKEGGVSEVSSSVEVEKGTAKSTGDAQNFAWASGVGYGSNRAPRTKASLDPAKLAAAKAERDFRRGTLLWRISVEISRCLSLSPSSSLSSSSSSCISSSNTGPGAVDGASSVSGGAWKEVEAVDKCDDDEYKTDKEDKEDKEDKDGDDDDGQPQVIASLSESQILQALRESSLLPCIQEFLEYPIAEVDRSPSLVYVVCLVLELLSDHRWPVLWGLLEAPILPLSEANESSSSASKSGVATLEN